MKEQQKERSPEKHHIIYLEEWGEKIELPWLLLFQRRGNVIRVHFSCLREEKVEIIVNSECPVLENGDAWGMTNPLLTIYWKKNSELMAKNTEISKIKVLGTRKLTQLGRG